MKQCNSCFQEKERNLFPTTGGKCKTCKAAISLEKYHSLTPDQKLARSQSPATVAARKRCRAKPETKAKEKAQNIKWVSENREWKGFVRRLSTYGLTLDQYHAMAEQQDFLCAICGEEPVAKKSHASNDNFVIDHNHRTNKVRGLLCGTCNTGIGQLQDHSRMMLRAASYLVKHEEREAA